MEPAQVVESEVLALQKPMNKLLETSNSPVQQFYNGTTVFVTGGCGFIGKQLVEKLLRTCAIKKMYLLVRPKKGRTEQERLKRVLEESVYDKLREKQPHFADKIIPIRGDISEIRLGLSEKDWKIITNEVNIIFHAAATVRFDEPLRKAIITNVRSTRECLTLARACTNFKQFIHVSTAFTYATKDRTNTDIMESFYPSPVPPETMIAFVENTDEKRLDDITTSLIKGWANTYTFTKALAEELIRISAGDIPVCIVRPPMVTPTYIEPNPGWTDIATMMGPSGIYLGVGLGVCRVICVNKNVNAAIAPLDFVNNAIIAAGWDSTVRRNNGEMDIPIYTIARHFSFGKAAEVIRAERYTLNTPKAVWRSELLEIENKFAWYILSWLLHYIPAYLADLICFVIGKRPKQISSFISIYDKIDKLGEAYQYFLHNEWYFKDHNVRAMIKRMSSEDKIIFNCDVSSINLHQYIMTWAIGLRKYVIKDGLTGTEIANRNQKIFLVLNYVVMALYAYLFWFILSTVFVFVKYIFAF